LKKKRGEKFNYFFFFKKERNKMLLSRKSRPISSDLVFTDEPEFPKENF
jgi:hypothetical protein